MRATLAARPSNVSSDPLDRNVGLHGTSGLLLGITAPGPGWLALALAALLAIGPSGATPRGAVLLGAALGWLRSGDATPARARPLPWDRQNHPASPARRARAWLRARLAACPPRTRRLTEALVLGIRLPERLRARYVRAGVVHLVSQSGLHVGLVFALVLVLARGHRAGPPLGITAAAAYATLAGDRSAAWRAVVMVTVGAAVRAQEREPDPRGGVLLTAAAFLLVRPDLVADPGTLLSFAAAFGIPHLEPLLRAHLPGTGVVARLLRPSLAAWLATAPVLAWLGASLVPLAPLTNVLAIPLGVALTSYGIVLVGAAALSPGLAAGLAPPFELGAYALDTLAWLAAHAPPLDGLALVPLAAGAVALALHHGGARAWGAPPEGAPDAPKAPREGSLRAKRTGRGA